MDPGFSSIQVYLSLSSLKRYSKSSIVKGPLPSRVLRPSSNFLSRMTPASSFISNFWNSSAADTIPNTCRFKCWKVHNIYASEICLYQYDFQFNSRVRPYFIVPLILLNIISRSCTTQSNLFLLFLEHFVFRVEKPVRNIMTIQYNV